MSKEYKAPEQTIKDISLLEPEATYSYADYLRWSFDERVELIRGKMFRMSPAPNVKHQTISFRLVGEISSHLKGRNCRGFSAPFDVRLPKKQRDPDSKIHTIVQPDLCVICDPAKLDDAGCIGAPDLIIEILSPATSKKDLTSKYELYEEHGVREYWVVYPGDEIVEVFILGATKSYLPGKKHTKEDQVTSTVLPGLAIRLKDIFIG